MSYFFNQSLKMKKSSTFSKPKDMKTVSGSSVSSLLPIIAILAFLLLFAGFNGKQGKKGGDRKFRKGSFLCPKRIPNPETILLKPVRSKLWITL